MSGSITLPGKHPLTAPIHTFGLFFYVVAGLTMIRVGTVDSWVWFFAGLGVLFNLIGFGTKRHVCIEGLDGQIMQINTIAFFPTRVKVADFPELNAVIFRAVRIPSDYTGQRSNVVTDIRFRTKQTKMLSFSLPMTLGSIDNAIPAGVDALPNEIKIALRDNIQLAQSVADMVGCPLTIDSPDLQG